jgi:hypothetical protein
MENNISDTEETKAPIQNPIKVKIVKRGSDYEIEVEVEDDHHYIITGGDSSNPTWDEYLEQFNDEVLPRILAIRKIIEDYKMVGELASSFCNNHHFEFEDGLTVGFTWRAWGDLMQAIVGKREGFMAYYH